MPFRYDSGALGKPKRAPNGWLRADGYLTRTGIFSYRNADGTERRELRLPEEVFRPDAMASFDVLPITLQHPAVPVDAENYREHTRGTVSSVKQDGDKMRGTLNVNDAEAIKALESGTNQLSCGYACDLEDKPGVWHGQHYDSIQRNIRGNHVAIVTRGRAGPECAVRMDSEIEAEAVGLHEADASHKLNTSVSTPEAGAQSARSIVTMDEITVKFDGVDVKLDAKVGKAIEAERASAKAAVDRECARADAAESKAAEAVKNADAIKASVPQLVASRVALEVVARKHLGETVKLDDKNDRDVKLSVLEKLKRPVINPATRSDDYVDGVFESACADAATRNPALDAARQAGARADVAPVGSEKDARARMLAANQHAYKAKE